MSAEFYSEEIKGIIREVTNDAHKMDSGELQWTEPVIEDMLNKISGAKDALTELENEIILVTTNEKYEYQKLVQNYKTEISNLEDKLKTTQKRVALLANAKVTDRERQAAVSLNETQAVMSQTVDIGNGILTSLRDQRTKLLNTHQHVHEIDATVDDTGNIVSRMFKRQNKNKLITYGVVGLLILGILLILYLKFF
ncbi:Vesicle transport v-SNARE protein [Trichomonas vaginalis G3]|uniref:Vesicle transport v-SNARE protein n=1 Tax=Trichomonas vaginalis (strain ATCC PRA-98 / G3) TaxID=412133 RepID=A2DXA3_TRIV3|nr:vesicle fusion with Golgi apparatus [Trichomonas vaginalis G3]EAY14985.1 Vesicle transport v-SNARE protein [Trichomonas vaginalis G3]KAI5507338.1 vesicle fusion with Golgi apparatus [Trichomonas vaginalis G3]|eukprot:XP_001327208.1 Vesicle transport v-SNARE protein [Trichomonas vaginalis G3]